MNRDDEVVTAHGWLLSLERNRLEAAIIDDVAAAGDRIIPVLDAEPFPEDGGWVRINDVVYQFESADLTSDPNTVTLASDLTGDLPLDGDMVQLWNPAKERVYGERRAWVELDIEDIGDVDPIPAKVKRSIIDRLDEPEYGERGSYVELERKDAGGDWKIVDVEGEELALDWSMLAESPIKWEEDDQIVLTSGHIIVGSVTLLLSHVPEPESFLAWHHFGGAVYAGVDQTDYLLDAEGQTCVFPLDGDGVTAGDVIRVRYPYRRGSPPAITVVDFAAIASTSTLANYGPGGITSAAMPAGAVNGDLLIVAAMGGYGSSSSGPTMTDGRLVEVAAFTLGGRPCGLYVGQVDAGAGAVSIALRGGNDVRGQFAHVAVSVLRGIDGVAAWDVARIADSGQFAGDSGSLPALSGAGSGAVAVVLAAGALGGAYGFLWEEAPIYSEFHQSGNYEVTSLALTKESVVTSQITPTDDPADVWRGVVVGLI